MNGSNRSKFCNFIKCIVFSIVLFLVYLKVNATLMLDVYPLSEYWPTTATYNQFYRMKEDSIDVLFLGTSVVNNAFIPQELYDKYGIRSYNFASPEQSIPLSYCYLEEVMKYQSPKLVVLDAYYLNKINDNDLNAPQQCLRRAIDPMKWSKHKIKAIFELCQLDEVERPLAYFLPVYCFHDRWKEIGCVDFDDAGKMKDPLYGWACDTSTYGTMESYEEYYYSGSSETVEFDAVMMEYLEKIRLLCEASGAELMLTTLPGTMISDGIHNALTEYASNNGMGYIDLAEHKVLEQIGAEYPIENVYHHENVGGAIKMTTYVGRLIQDIYGLEPVSDEQWEIYEDYYRGRVQEYYNAVEELK